MKRWVWFIGLFWIVTVMPGCAKVVIKSDADPSADLAALEKFYVVKGPEDKSDLAKIISDKLNTFGFQSTSGLDTTPPEPVDAVVTYKDRWMWDITMYMLEINIGFRDPETNFMFASGKSYRTSLARKPPAEMIDEVLRDMFAGKIELPEKVKVPEKEDIQ